MRKTKRTASPEPFFANSPARAYADGLLRRWVREGGPELVDDLEARGYGWITGEVAAA